MANIRLDLDSDSIAKLLQECASEVQQDLQKAVSNLASMTHAHVTELATQELKSSKKTLTDNLSWAQIADGVWAVTIHSPAMWIEDGIKPNTDMKPGLLKNPRISHTGTRYKVIPMDKSKPPSQLAPPAQNDLQQLKQALKDKGIPFKKLEFNQNGSPKLGKIHSLKLGGRVPGKGNTPVLDGVNIYQHKDPMTGKISRQITTFRTVTDKSDGWIHPGMTPKNFLDRSAVWAENIWESQILPEIMKKWGML